MRPCFAAIFLMIFVCSTSKLALGMNEFRIRSNSAPLLLRTKTAEQEKAESEARKLKRAMRAATMVNQDDAPPINDVQARWEATKINAQSVQDFLVCPLSGEPLVDPVIATDGHTYERKALIRWLNGQQGRDRLSPMSGQPLQPIEIRLGAPPEKEGGLWRIRPKKKWLYFVTDATLLHAIVLYKNELHPKNEEEIFSDPLDRSRLLEQPVTLGDGVTYSFQSINHYLDGARKKGFIKNPFHDGAGSEYFQEFITVEYVPSPVSGEEIKRAQIVVHMKIWAILDFLKKKAKFAAENKLARQKKEKNRDFYRMRSCGSIRFRSGCF